MSETGTGTLLDEASGGAEPSRPEKTNRRWQGWEAAFLLGSVLDGTEMAEIAPTLKRSVSACHRELGRLLDGDVTCPRGSEGLLKQVREKLSRRGLWEPRESDSPVAGPRPADSHAEPVRQLRRQQQIIRQALSRVERLQWFSLALGVVAGEITERDVRLHCDGHAAREVGRLAAAIRAQREAAAEWAGEMAAEFAPPPRAHDDAEPRPQTVLTQDGHEFPPAGEDNDLPAVQIGQGDFARPWPPGRKPVA